MLTKAVFIRMQLNTVKQYIFNIITLLNFIITLYYYTTEFSESLLQSLVSHDPSEIILICCSTFFLISYIIYMYTHTHTHKY